MPRVRLLAVALAAVLAPPAARAADPAAARALTPDALGFLHVRVGDVWTADAAKQLRDFAAQAGPDLLRDFDARFVPAPSDVESFTVVLFDPKFRDVLPIGRATDKTPVWVVTSKQPLDRVELFKTMARTGRTKRHNGTEYIFDEAHWSGLLLLGDRSYAYASEDSITDLIDRMAKGGESPLSAVLAREHDKHPALLGVNVVALVKPETLRDVPDGLQPLFKARTWLAALDLKPKTAVSVTLEFGTEAQARDGLKAAQEGVQMVRGFIGQGMTFVEGRLKREPGKPAEGVQRFPEKVGLLLAVAGLRQLDALLAGAPVEVKGNTVRGALDLDSLLPGGATVVSVAAVATAITYAMADADRSDGSRIAPGDYDWTDRERNLASIARAVEAYRKDKGHYPPPAILSKDGKPLLSWRVAILPYIQDGYVNNSWPEKSVGDTKALYALFKLDEPWDSPHNKKLIAQFPSVYRAPYSVLTYSQSSVGKTTVMAVAGKGAIFDPTRQVTDGMVRDGMAQTLLLLSVEESAQATYWTKPHDITLTAEGQLPAGAPNFAKRFAAVYADGSARTLASGLDPKTFLGVVTRDGAEKLDEKVIRPDPIRKGPQPFDK